MDLAIVYMVAGMSSRFEGQIKQFAKVGPRGETLIEYSLNQALAAGFNKIVFIVGDKTEGPFQEMFGNEYKGVKVFYAQQKFDQELRDRPWGTTDALCTLKGVIDCDFVVCNGDDIYGEDAFKLLAGHLQEKATNATIGYKIKNVLSETSSVNRGKFETDTDGNMETIEEVFDIQESNLAERGITMESLCSMNIWAFQSKTIELLAGLLSDFKLGHRGDRRAECLLPDMIGKLIATGEIKVHVYPTDEECYGVTAPGDEERISKKILESENN